MLALLVSGSDLLALWCFVTAGWASEGHQACKNVLFQLHPNYYSTLTLLCASNSHATYGVLQMCFDSLIVWVT